MPYIAHERRVSLDVILDGLIKQIRSNPCENNSVRYVAFKVLFGTDISGGYDFPQLVERYAPLRAESIRNITDELIQRLASIGTTRGDVNYVLTRVSLESLKPVAGWGYHPLSNVVALLNNVSDMILKEASSDEMGGIWLLVSIPRDAAAEIERRLLGPYEDTAILKNGDMHCFQESFAHQPQLIRTAQDVVDGVIPKFVPPAGLYPHQRTMLDMVNGLAASAACDEPGAVRLCDVAEELEDQLLADLEARLETLEAEHFRFAKGSTKEQMDKWEEEHNYHRVRMAYKDRINKIKAERRRES